MQILYATPATTSLDVLIVIPISVLFMSGRLFRYDSIIVPQSDQHIEKHVKGDLRGADSGLDLSDSRLADPEFLGKGRLRQLLCLPRLDDQPYEPLLLTDLGNIGPEGFCQLLNRNFLPRHDQISFIGI